MSNNYVRQTFKTESWPAIAKGCTGFPSNLPEGGTQASGTVTFADNPTASDTLTLNGVYVEFTASPSDATTAGTVGDPLLINIKVSLDLTLDEMISILNNGSAPAAIQVATYTENGATVLTITYDTNTYDGNLYTLVSSADTVSAATLEGGQGTGYISLTTENNEITLSQATDQDFILADGVAFQHKTIVLTAKGAGSAVITPDNFTDGTTITLDTVNDYVKLEFIVDAWKVVGTSVATIA